MHFVGTQVDPTLKINIAINYSGIRAKSGKSDPAQYVEFSGQCAGFSEAIVYDSGVFWLNDGRANEEPLASATYHCQ